MAETVTVCRGNAKCSYRDLYKAIDASLEKAIDSGLSVDKMLVSELALGVLEKGAEESGSIIRVSCGVDLPLENGGTEYKLDGHTIRLGAVTEEASRRLAELPIEISGYANPRTGAMVGIECDPALEGCSFALECH